MATKKVTDEAAQVRTLIAEVKPQRDHIVTAITQRALALGIQQPPDVGAVFDLLVSMAQLGSDGAVAADVALSSDHSGHATPATERETAFARLGKLVSDDHGILERGYGRDAVATVFPGPTPHTEPLLLAYVDQVTGKLFDHAKTWTATNSALSVNFVAMVADLTAAATALRAAIAGVGASAQSTRADQSARDVALTGMHDTHRALLHGGAALLEAGGLRDEAAALLGRHVLTRAHPARAAKDVVPPAQPAGTPNP
jgi:hypothetical protein